MCREFRHQERKVMSSATAAADIIRRMVRNEVKGWGDQENALRRIARRFGIPFWTLNHIRTGRAKTVDADVITRIREAYAEHCRQHAARLLHEAEMAKAGNPDVHLADIEDQIRALVAQLEAAKAGVAGEAR